MANTLSTALRINDVSQAYVTCRKIYNGHNDNRQKTDILGHCNEKETLKLLIDFE